jgi:glycosyltransferase involved in cell wall biosynthesis
VIDLAVVAQDPAFGGGARAMTDAFLAAASELGRSPDLLFAEHPTLHGRRLTLDRIEWVRQQRAGRRLAPSVASARSAWVVAAAASHGYAALRSGRPYAAWLATSLEDEWSGRRTASLPLSRHIALELNRAPLRRIERSVLAGATRVYAAGRSSRRSLARAGGLNEIDIEVLPLPVDLTTFLPEDEKPWLARLDAPVVAFVGRAWDPRKNVSLLLDALPILRRRVPRASVRLIGEPPRRPLPAGVEATGPVTSVAEHLRTASLFVLPSWQEGFGIVAAEALAAGVPVLATRSDGPEELLEASAGGRLLDGFAAEELAEVAADLLEDGATLAAMRESGRAYVAREHSPERLRELLARALAELP